MENRPLRVGFVSNCPVGGKTGLGRNMKEISPLLYKSKKYELFFLSQGMQDNDPNFQKLPFKCEGVFKNFDQNRMQDHGYARAVSYGNMAIENFVISNKLDCLILSDDAWAFLNEFYLNTDWFNHMKSNIMPIITADSEPLMPQIKEWAEKCPNMKFWTEFAVRVLKEENLEKYKHCGVIYGALNTNIFKPLLKHERLSIRKKFNIADHEKIIIYLGRNQLRKIYASHIEGLSKFRKRHPEKKLRLLFHCSWAEPGGWPLNQIREQYGLKKEDILTTYYCGKCTNWNIQPYEGENLDCHECHCQKSRCTAGVSSTVNEEDLNKIYNIADGSASIFTSGSYEFTNPESMLAGVPLACPNYVCGEDFINSKFVYQIKGTYTWEHQTGFKKFVADTNSVCDFFEYICNLTDDKKKELTTKARQWAVEKFDSKNVIKKYEEFIDSCKPIDWTPLLEKKKELKNPNAQVQDSQDDIEFVKNCYRDILNCPDVEKSDNGGFNHWINYLKQPTDKSKLKNDMVNCFRSAANDHNRRNNPVPFEMELIKNDKKNLLIVLKESIGDLILSTSLLKSFRYNYAEKSWNIYFATDPKYKEIFDGNKNINKVLDFQPFMEQEILCTGAGKNKGYFDAYSHLGNSQQHKLNYLSNNNIGKIVNK